MKENNPYKRKFDSPNTAENHFALLETFYYHFVDQKDFAGKLKKSLMLEGIIPEDGQLKDLWLKEIFKVSNTYKHGFVLVNSPEKRQKSLSTLEEEQTFRRSLVSREYKMQFQTLNDKQNNAEEASMKTAEFRLTPEDGFTYWLLYSVLYYYKNGFFRFSNLKKHIVELADMREFIEKFLPKYTIQYRYKDESIKNMKGKE